MPKLNRVKLRKFSNGVKHIFIDRDGVINKDPGGWTKYEYVTRWADFHFIPGSLDALKKLNKNGIRVVVISNQAGVGKGYFSRADLDGLTARMFNEVTKNGGRIEKAYYCLHTNEDNCNCRKPKSGLLEMAAKELGAYLKGSYFVGDTQTDCLAAHLAGCKAISVLSGKADEKEIRRWPEKPDYVFGNLLEAVNWLIEKERRKARRAFGRDR